MKRHIFILSILCRAHVLIGAPGCMDNSYRLTQQYDTKDYHYVDCNCPCEKRYKIINRKSTCSKCGHYRDPRFSAMLIEHGPITCPKAFSNFACAKKISCTDKCSQ